MNNPFPAPFKVIGRSVVDWWDGWLDMAMVVSIWFLAQATVIFGPPATFGLYHVTYNMINGEALGVRGLFEGAKKYLKKSLIWGAINLFALATIFVNFTFYGGVQAAWGPYVQMVVVGVAWLYLSTQFYTIPYFMEQEVPSLKIAMRNGLFTTLASPLFTFIVMVVAAVVVVLSIMLVIPIFLGLPGLIAFLGFRALNDRLVTFGIRQPEKTPKEIEMEESGRIYSQTLPTSEDQENRQE
ncbi:MAG: hypothetical protein GX491_16455 [Chloroflexi bacterium]|nr:hypothetical protein [Chloroflexota bacterium]